MPTPSRRILDAAGALGLVALSVLCLGRIGPEMSAVQLGRAPEPRQIAALAGVLPPELPLSLRGRQAVLLACDAGLRGAAGQVQPQALRDRVARRCDTIARRVLADSPTLSLGHLVLAEAALAQDRPAEADTALRRAQATAPTEAWLARHRVDLAAPQTPRLSAPTLAALDRDLALLTEAPRDLALLAALYQRDPALRPRLIAVIERAPEAAQRAFLRLVRQGGGGA